MSQPPEETPETAAGTLPAADLPYHGSDPWLHNVCVAAAILAPVGLLLPPRRMGPRSLLLAAGTFFATSQLTYDYTGHSLFARFQQRANQVTTSDLPEAAVRRQAAMRAERSGGSSSNKKPRPSRRAGCTSCGWATRRRTGPRSGRGARRKCWTRAADTGS